MASISELSKGIGNWLSIPWPVVCVALVIALFGWVCWRTRSWHFVRVGLWRVAMRRSRSTDLEISKWIESRERLMDFRYFFGVQARTLAQARRIGRWALEMDEDLGAVACCGDHFDREHCRLKTERIPNRAAMAFVVLAASVLALVSLASALAASTHLALLQFNDSGTLFSLSRDRAETLTGRGVLTLQSCAIGADAAKFTKEERDVLCDALKKPGIDEFIHESVLQQRAVFWPAALLFFLFALTSWAEFRKGAAAREMRVRLERRSAGGRTDASSAPP